MMQYIAKEFFAYTKFDASILTKTDADAKGGAIITILRKFFYTIWHLPLKSTPRPSYIPYQNMMASGSILEVNARWCRRIFNFIKENN